MFGVPGEGATYHAVASSGHEVVLKVYDPVIGQRADVMAKLAQVHESVAQLPIAMVVPAADSGYDPTTSAPYVVSEFVQQPSLDALVRNGPLAPLVVAKILENLARVLETCHARHIHHLALKPANIFVGPGPEFAVRVCDFGVSIVRSTGPTHETFAKSAPWWAPEQLQPTSALGAPADVFTAALLAFYLLTAKSFWQSCQSFPPDLARLRVEVAAPRVTVSQRGTQLGVVLPASLDAVFSWALSVDQNARPASLMALVQAIVAAAGGASPVDDEPQQRPALTMAFPEFEATPLAGNGQQKAAEFGYPGAPTGGVGGGSLTPGLPPVAPEVRRNTSAAKPILIGVGMAMLVVGVLAFFLLRQTKPKEVVYVPDAGPVSVPLGAPPNAASEVPALAIPNSAEEVVPLETASSDVANLPPVEPEKITLTLTCSPACEQLLVDNEIIPILEEKTELKLVPGKHNLEAHKTGFIVIKETIDVTTASEKVLRFYRPGVGTSSVVKPCVRGILKKCP